LVDRYENQQRKDLVLLSNLRFLRIVQDSAGSEADKVERAQKNYARSGRRRSSVTSKLRSTLGAMIGGRKTGWKKVWGNDILVGELVYACNDGGGVHGVLGTILSYL